MFVWALSHIPKGGKENTCTIEKSGASEPEKKHCVSKVDESRYFL